MRGIEATDDESGREAIGGGRGHDDPADAPSISTTCRQPGPRWSVSTAGDTVQQRLSDRPDQCAGNDIAGVGRDRISGRDPLRRRVELTERHLGGSGRHAGDHPIEVGGPDAVIDHRGTLHTRRCVTDHGRREGLNGRGVRVRTVHLVEQDQRFVGPARLTQRQRQRHTGLGALGTHGDGALDGQLGDCHGSFTEPHVHSSACCSHRREREVAERLTDGERLLDPPFGLVGPSERHQRPHTRPHRQHRTEPISELTERVQRLARQLLGLTESSTPQTDRRHERVHHRRRPGISERDRLLAHRVRQRLRLVESSLVEAHVGQQARRPAPTGAVAEQIEVLGGHQQPLFGQHGVARQERHPRLVLADPRLAAPVPEPLAQSLGLAEQPLGIFERPTEHLGEPPLAQRGRQLDVVAELAEDLDARSQFLAGGVEVAVALMQRSEQASRLGLVAPIARCERRLERVECIGASVLRRTTLRLGQRPQQQQLPGELVVLHSQVERSGGVTARLVERTHVDRPPRGVAQETRPPGRPCSPGPPVPGRSRRSARQRSPHDERSDRAARSATGT